MLSFASNFISQDSKTNSVAHWIFIVRSASVVYDCCLSPVSHPANNVQLVGYTLHLDLVQYIIKVSASESVTHVI